MELVIQNFGCITKESSMARGRNVVTKDECGWNVVENQGMRRVEVLSFVPASRAFVLGSLLVVLQILDGLLTSVGVIRYGTAAEGNPFLRHMMEEFGHLPTIAVCKFLAILIVITLTVIARNRIWVQQAMGVVSCFYLVGAIIPWTIVLYLGLNA